MKSFLIGTIIAVTIAIITTIVSSAEHIAPVLGSVALLFGVAVIALARAAVNGDRTRANYATENKRDRDERHIAIRATLLVGLPSLLIAFIFKYIFLF